MALSPSISSGRESKDGIGMEDLGVKRWHESQTSLAELVPDDKKAPVVVETIAEEDDLEGNQEPESADNDHIALKALHVDDDPTQSPWTFRMFFLGLGLSAFGSALATIFLFKPQSVSVSVIFLTVISYVLGNGMAVALPKTGVVGRWLNPHSFNSKEHLAIIIMSSSASGAAYATEVLAAQKLYYNVVPSALVAVLLLFSSQLQGYGMAGVLRRSLVYPTKMVWPGILPLSSLVETLHRDRAEMKKRFNFFWIVFWVVAVWELFPQYIMPFLTGISIFCLAKRDSLVFTNLFGGASGNEGLGLFGISFDWQYVTTSAFVLPPVTVGNGFVGYVLCTVLFIGLYYGNVWSALKFPFLAQELFSQASNSSQYVVYNQSAILDAHFEVDPATLSTEGLPFFAASNASYLLTTNLSIAATVVHIYLWHYDAVKSAFQVSSWPRHRPRFGKPSLPSRAAVRRWASPRRLLATWRASAAERAAHPNPHGETDPHYLKMLAYDEVPSWWYVAVLVVSTIVALGCIYNLNSTLPWWGFFIATLLSFLATLFFGALSGLIGFGVPITTVVQLIGGYLHPGKPVANMYFVLFGANAQSQALFLVSNLKLGQYGKLSPRCTFVVTLVGTLLGAVINYVLMSSITTNQRDILLSIQGTNIWSGQVIQSFNSNAIAFGGLSKYMFSIGRTYQWIVLALPLGLVFPLPFYFLHRWYPKMGFNTVVTPVILWYLGYLCVGINSSVMVLFILSFYIQFYVRKRYVNWFLRYNYILAAAISGGTELLVFVTTFAVQGAGGPAVPFPPYWGNNFQTGNFDFCPVNPALN
ncbi:Oligopeptide transporter OPT superfamily [Niveomyces insectorum RCEF 264]|uniref:Oligopeptide transporter OPT superfamily n=1 Tax=Niveomyces insectorum RCEF 264 TaxID=1081102 RepID=A0A167Y573_9HYPO|nr:Oligopeptide transporter OPT superfamily [Niveomyces insectorum RCEF 264]